VFEASANGAAVAGKTATAVLLNYISFIAFLYWVNATLDWIGDHVGFDGLSFEVRAILLSRELFAYNHSLSKF
jgi:nucleoside permease NupC